MKCLCGDIWPGCDADSECPFYECGYEWCPKCDDHHRPPVCVTVIKGEVPDIPPQAPGRSDLARFLAGTCPECGTPGTQRHLSVVEGCGTCTASNPWPIHTPIRLQPEGWHVRGGRRP